MIRRAKDLSRDDRGAAIVEFALVAPVLLMMMLGIFDLGYNMYANTMLQGAIQQAARNSTIEGATTEDLDATVTRAVRNVVPAAQLDFSRTNYSDFDSFGRPEDWNDLNGDGICNDGEPFEDRNGNGFWDEDRGQSGQGGARDAVLYRVTVSYPRAFPVSSLMGLSRDYQTEAVMALRNQPYNIQSNRAGTGNCP